MGPKLCVGGKWKMNGDKASITLATGPLNADNKVVAGCPAPYLSWVRSTLSDTVNLTALNCYKVAKGAFTGEISPAMLKDLKMGLVILGHSEHRAIFGKLDKLIADTIVHALTEGLKVIACIGETLQEREAGLTEAVYFRQTRAIAERETPWGPVSLQVHLFAGHHWKTA